MTIDELQFDFLDEESAKQAIERVGTLADWQGTDTSAGMTLRMRRRGRRQNRMVISIRKTPRDFRS